MVATVYDPSDGSGDAGRLGLPPWPQALRMLAELNQALRSLATEHRALVADVHARFLSHGLAAGDAAQPAARPPDRGLWYCGLIEPNAWGASEIRAAFWETLAFIETKPQSRDRQSPTRAPCWSDNEPPQGRTDRIADAPPLTALCAQQPRSNFTLRAHTSHHSPAFLLWCNALLHKALWWALCWGSLDGMQGVRLGGEPAAPQNPRGTC